jgi:type IV pilus secretin PilQ/predicted competence protein
MNKVTKSQGHKVTRVILAFLLLSFTCFIIGSYAQAAENFKFKDADIRVVLQAIAQKASISTGIEGELQKVNIIVSPKVKGLVTVNLDEVDWLTALEGILKAYGYGYEWIEDDLILVATLEDLAEQREKNAVAAQQEPLETVTYTLRYLDANDVKKLIEPQLTPRGRITILEVEAQKKWKARGGYAAGKGEEEKAERAEREEGARPRTKKLVVTDTKSNVRNIIASIMQLDIMPKQILIKAKVMEVSRDSLRDLGLDFATGSTGVTDANDVYVDGTGHHFEFNDAKTGKTAVGGASIADVTPSVFDPKSAGIAGVTPYTAGLEFIFRRLTDFEFEAILHALEETVDANILSAPHILTLDGQEAYIMVGYKRPIIKSTIQASEGAVGIAKELYYYQNLGIELNVVPQISDEDFINMQIYPSVTSSTEDVEATSMLAGVTSTDTYPIIDVRETQTQILMRDGETIVIGGLIKDVQHEGVIKVPILGDIPILGLLFQRRTTDVQKIDLLIFITAHIIDPANTASQEFVNTEKFSSGFTGDPGLE